jgi:hypothetical protein
MMTTPTPTAAEDITATAESTPPPRLKDRIKATTDPDEILDLFMGWVADIGFDLYPAQEEALLELMAGKHVILNTPTGSGKSLVALGLHFKGLCEGRLSVYTSPIKALASEKFFNLCEELGAENVGMRTGDASINSDATVICCTAEVLSNMALRQGEGLGSPYVIMDEFHYYADRDRGVAWQVPLLTLPHARFLLMSATLGNTYKIQSHIEEQTDAKVALVYSDDRPVPLDFEYRETPLHETIQYLHDTGRTPVYVVSFTQRECAELAQSMTSMQLCTREERERIWDAMKEVRFDTPYGKEMKRFLRFGIGVHHAGLLPRYRLLVEQLSQQGMLKVICGTDTLGVGVNIPIRTVLFTKLCKYDGRKTKILSVRDFKQIAGRAGRKGFDVQGSVVCQAPEYVIENIRLEQKAKAGRKFQKKKPPTFGFVEWNKNTFKNLIERPPETLKSRFKITHGMLLNLLQHDAEVDALEDNFSSLRRIIERCHEDDERKRALIRFSAILVRSLYRSGILKVTKDTDTEYRWVVVNQDLQWDFSLFQALSLYLVETLERLEPEDPDYALDVLTLVEAILEDPRAILRAQLNKVKDELIGRLKAERVPYEERMEKLEEATHPMPKADFIYQTFEEFRNEHPWVGGEDIRPKSIGRELFEGYMSFPNYIRRYGLQRSEGLLLRYLSQLYKTLDQSVPEPSKTESVYDALGFIRAMVERVDSSLLEEWENMLHPELRLKKEEERRIAEDALRMAELLHDPKAFQARIRAEMHQLVRELAHDNYEEAVACVRHDPQDPWTEARFEAALAPYYEEYDKLIFGPEARQSDKTTIRSTGHRTWDVTQALVDPQGDNMWFIDGHIDLSHGQSLEGVLVKVRGIGR